MVFVFMFQESFIYFSGSAKFVTLRILYDDSVVDDELVETLSRLKEKASNIFLAIVDTQ